jgi:hypothetical protein
MECSGEQQRVCKEVRLAHGSSGLWDGVAALPVGFFTAPA